MQPIPAPGYGDIVITVAIAVMSMCGNRRFLCWFVLTMMTMAARGVVQVLLLVLPVLAAPLVGEALLAAVALAANGKVAIQASLSVVNLPG